MPVGGSPVPVRDYSRLFRAINEVLAVLAGDGDPKQALEASFDAAAAGFGAQKALLLLVEEREPQQLRCLLSRGTVTAAQVAACERGESVKGVSPSVIRDVIASGRPALVEDPRLHAEVAKTSSLKGGHFSVVCAPMVAPAGGAVLAVVYFQSSALAEAYGPSDLAWIEGYATAVGRAFALHLSVERRRREVEDLIGTGGRPDDAPELVGDSAATRALRRELHEIHIPALQSEKPDPVLLLGERGTGKDLVARYVHAYCDRRKGPFVVANCAEISDDLAASRFFGHKKGTFTGATADEPGLFRAAHGGFLFLDEIGDLSPRAQATLLRVLENHAVVPVGQTREIPVDVAVVLATNRDLARAAEEGALRQDFYDRFRVHAIRLTALRERRSDVSLLLEHFRGLHERRARKRTLGFTPEALRLLVGYDWPGNVRELARACSLFVTYAKPGAWIDLALVKRCYPEIASAPTDTRGTVLSCQLPMHEAVQDFQRELILSRLELHGSVKAARESLKLRKTTFHRYAKMLGISAGAESRAGKNTGGED